MKNSLTMFLRNTTCPCMFIVIIATSCMMQEKQDTSQQRNSAIDWHAPETWQELLGGAIENNVFIANRLKEFTTNMLQCANDDSDWHTSETKKVLEEFTTMKGWKNPRAWKSLGLSFSNSLRMASLVLASEYHYFYGVGPNRRQGFDLIPEKIPEMKRRTAEGDGHAAHVLYVHYRLGIGSDSSRIIADYWLRKCIDLKYQSSNEKLLGREEPLSDEQIEASVTEAENGDAEAAYRLYKHYSIATYEGNSKRALKWLYTAADLGHECAKQDVLVITVYEK